MAGEALLALVILFVWFAISYFVYHHAEENGHTGALWAIVVFLFGIPGIILYGLVHLVSKE